MKLRQMLAMVSVAAALQQAHGVEHPSAGGLEEYLKKLGYEPIRLTSNEYQLRAKASLGNGRKLSLLVDTGWMSLTTLTPRAATGLKTLGELGVLLNDSLFGPLTNTSIVLIDKLVLGRAQFLNQPAQVEEIKFDYIHVPYDGALGYDFYFRNFCLIDCRGQCLYVRAAEPSEDQSRALETSLRRGGSSAVPLRFKRWLTVDAQINQRPVQLIVDTGSVNSTLDESQLKPLGLAVVKQPTPDLGTMIPGDLSTYTVGVGKVGAHKLRASTIESLRIGDQTWKNVHFGIQDLRAWKIPDSEDPARGADGILGMDMLLNNRALIDFASRRLWFVAEKKGL